MATAFVMDVSSNLPVAESNQCRALPESVTANRLLPDIPIAVTPAGICTENNCLLSATWKPRTSLLEERGSPPAATRLPSGLTET